MHEKQIKWLLNGDPAIRYQVLRDITRAGAVETHAERERILNEGWGRRLQGLQDKKPAKDSRMQDAITLLIDKQTPEGFWNLEKRYPARNFFEMESVGKAGRWNTLRALRIMQWWKG